MAKNDLTNVLVSLMALEKYSLKQEENFVYLCFGLA